MIADLYVLKDGPYFGLPGVDPWDESRDARLYRGPWPVVAHPPCERWGRYWSGGPSAKIRKLKGDDLGCFDRALWAVRTFGGVLEHPAHSSAWNYYNLKKPSKTGWLNVGPGEFATEISQGLFGHPANKKTWLYAVFKGDPKLPFLGWGRAPVGRLRLDEGFHSKEERAAARASGKTPIKRLSSRQNAETPIPFRDLLISIAEAANG